MDYEKIRTVASTGDVVGVQGNGLYGRLIKLLTKEKYTHVAMFVWHGTGLWLYEFVEGRGFQCMPASQWFELRKGQKIFFGKGPIPVRSQPERVIEVAGSFRTSNLKQRYGIVSLAKIVLSQWTGKKLPTFFKNCSTFVQYVWENCGYELFRTADPGDIMRIAAEFGPLKEYKGEPSDH